MCLSASYCHNKNNSSFLKMMLILNVLLIFSSFSTIQSYIFSPKTSTSLLSRTIRSKVEVGINNKPSSQKWRSNVLLKMMSDSEASSSEIEIVAEDTSSQSTSSQPSDPNDFSQYAVGNQYPATLVSSKSFGLFAKISTGKDVLLPRALMSRSQFDKFTKMLEDKAKKEIKVELVSVSAENSTLSARLVQSLNLDDLSEDRVFNATVSSIHDFGLFATVEEIGAEGLVPISKLNVNAADIKSLYSRGQEIKVRVLEYKEDTGKLTFELDEESLDEDLSDSLTWHEAVVLGVKNIGLFVRPAGFDQSGLVHISKIPLDLIEALKKRAPIPSGSTVSEIESLFSAGDIVKVRVLGANKEGKLDMAMVPPLTAVQEESFNFVEGRDSEEAPEVSEDDEADSDDAVAKFDAEDTLVWWRGAPYVKSSAKTDEEDEDLAEATEENVAFELDAMIEGTWRRMFELDMQEDAADFESKASDKDIKELEEEIGDLMGMDEELIQDGFGIEFNYEINSLGNSIPIDMIPEQWRSEMSYYNDFETEDKKRMEILRGGKKRDDQDLQGVIVLTEKEMAEANKGKRVSDFTPSDKIVSSEVGTEAEAPAPVE